MKFKTKLIQATIIKRYKRFLVDIILNESHLKVAKNEQITIHTSNTGSMKTCLDKNWPCAISYHDSPTRKLKYSLELTHNGNSWIGVNTILPNKLVKEAIGNGQIPELDEYEHIKPEFSIGDSRIDFLLYSGESIIASNKKCFVEVKSVSMKSTDNYAIFPDAVSLRAQKHIRELIKISTLGDRAVLLFIIQREDILKFRPAHEIDPEYANLLKEASENGVEVLVYRCVVNLEEIYIDKSIPIDYSLL